MKSDLTKWSGCVILRFQRRLELTPKQVDLKSSEIWCTLVPSFTFSKLSFVGKWTNANNICLSLFGLQDIWKRHFLEKEYVKVHLYLAQQFHKTQNERKLCIFKITLNIPFVPLLSVRIFIPKTSCSSIYKNGWNIVQSHNLLRIKLINMFIFVLFLMWFFIAVRNFC